MNARACRMVEEELRLPPALCDAARQVAAGAEPNLIHFIVP